MVAVHSLIAEVLAYLVNTLEAAHDEALQVELGGDTHVHILIERIEVGDERTGRGTAGNHLQGRSLHLGIAGLIEHAAHGAQHGGTLQEGIFHTLVHHQVDIALAVAQLGVVELVVSHAILIFHDRKRFERFREQGQLLCMHRNLARLCTEHETADSDEVADVHQLLEHHIIHILILTRADVITCHIHLNTALRVLQFHKRGLAHHAAAHHTTGNAYLTRLSIVDKFGTDICAESICGILGCRIWVDAHRTQLLQALAPADFLFTQF